MVWERNKLCLCVTVLGDEEEGERDIGGERGEGEREKCPDIDWHVVWRWAHRQIMS